MSENNDVSELMKEFEAKYPGAYVLFTLIGNNFNELCADMLKDSSIGKEEKLINLYIKKDSEGKARLALSKESTLLLMAISESVMQMFARFLNPGEDYKEFESRLKKEMGQ